MLTAAEMWEVFASELKETFLMVGVDRQSFDVHPPGGGGVSLVDASRICAKPHPLQKETAHVLRLPLGGVRLLLAGTHQPTRGAG